MPVRSGVPGGGWLRGLAVVRRFGPAALPLALAGLLPWWCVLLLCVLFGASAVSPRWREARLLLGVAVVGVAILPGLVEVMQRGRLGVSLFLALQERYFLGLVAVVLLHWGASLLAEGSRKGLLVVAGVGLLAPGPWLVLALALGALSRAGADDRTGFLPESPAQEAPQTRYVGWLAGALAFLLAFALVLPRSAPGGELAPRTAETGTLSTVPGAELPGTPAPRGELPQEAPQPGLSLGSGTLVPTPPLELVLVMGALLMLVLAYRMLTLPGSGWRRFSLLDWVLAGALLLNMGFVLMMTLTPETQGVFPPPSGVGTGAAPAQSEGNIPERARQVVPFLMEAMNLLVWLVLAFQAALLVAMAAWLWQKRQAQGEVLAAELDPAAVGPTEVPGFTGHRVRVAYRAALDALERHGWGRLDGETPARFAARLSGAQRAFAPPLTLLTSLYEPVRYGGRVTEEEAAEAEQAMRELAELAALYPFIESEEEHQE